MGGTPEDTDNWRDLHDQLTGEQIAAIESFEARSRLMLARRYAEHNLRATLHSGVAVPAGVADVGEWDEDYVRVLFGQRYGNALVNVKAAAGQDSSGALRVAHVLLSATDTGSELTPAQARELAQWLIAAAGQAEAWRDLSPIWNRV